MATPRPTPTALKLLRGNPGQRKLNEDEPKLTAEIPTMPGNLRDKEAREEWKRMTKVLAGVGVLSRIDAKALALYCDTWSEYREARNAIAKEGPVLLHANGSWAQNPRVAIEHRARADLMKMLVEFGMTPASRTKIKVLPGGKKDELDSFLESEAG